MYSKSEMACFAEGVKFIFQISVLISKCQLWGVIIMKKLYALGYGELLMVSRDEEHGAFAGVGEGV